MAPYMPACKMEFSKIFAPWRWFNLSHPCIATHIEAAPYLKAQ
jgi:hypothetical protein